MSQEVMETGVWTRERDYQVLNFAQNDCRYEGGT